MNIVKPLQLSALHKAFSFQGKSFFSVGSLIPFALSSGDILLEQDMWSIIGEHIDGDIFDAAMPKQTGEVLVCGNFISPNGSGIEAGSVKLSIEQVDSKGISHKKVDKELAIFGDRYWIKLLGAGITPSNPTKFKEMSITYGNAFGGEGFKPNPNGKGFKPIETEFGERQYLPNIEYKSKLITSPSFQPTPASFGRIDIMSSPRIERAGTYDQKYIETRMPGLPDDIDWLYFNDAAEDQWIDGYFNGDEKYFISNMHSEHRVLQGTLPPIYGRAFVNQLVPLLDIEGNKTGESEIQFKEIDTKLDTLYLFPNADLGVMIYRGTLESSCDIGSDIKALLLACENRKDNPRGIEHYHDQLKKRLDPDHGYKYALFSAPLIAEGMRCGFEKINDTQDFPLEMLAKDNLDKLVSSISEETNKAKNNAQEEIEKLCKEAGMDVEAFFKNLENPIKSPEQIKLESLIEKLAPGITSGKQDIDIFNIDLTVIDEIKTFLAEIENREKEIAKERIKSEIEKLKQLNTPNITEPYIEQLSVKLEEIELPPIWPRIDLDSKVDELKKQKEVLKQQLESIETNSSSEIEQKINDLDIEKLESKLKEAETNLKSAYLMGAHLFGEARSPHPEKEQLLKEELIAKYASKEDLTNRDFACIDLSGQDLTGIDLSGCYLEGVNFSDCNLSNANLAGAIAAGANFSGAILTNANCKGANIGATDLTHAILNGSDLSDCQLGGATFRDTQIENCALPKGNYLDTTFENVSFKNSDLSESNFINPVFKGCVFENANLTQTNYVEGQFIDCDFSSATLDGANFVKAKLENAKFGDAKMINVRFVGGCDILEADFTGANVSKSCLRENMLNHAVFDRCVLDEADFSGAQLIGASFKNAKAYRTQFMLSHISSANFENINLMEGSMYKAYAVGAKFDRANLYSVNFMDATLGQNTYKGANLDQTILKEWRP
jgi:uncharacterized protein YjbI with pentapeptide repeats